MVFFSAAQQCSYNHIKPMNHNMNAYAYNKLIFFFSSLIKSRHSPTQYYVFLNNEWHNILTDILWMWITMNTIHEGKKKEKKKEKRKPFTVMNVSIINLTKAKLYLYPCIHNFIYNPSV